MTKRSLYKKLVCQFESTINNYQSVNAEFDFNAFEKIISNQKKDNRYYSGLQKFLVYLRKFEDENQHIFIFPEVREKYECLLEKVKTLLTARSLEVSRQTRSTNNCVIEDPHCSQYNDNLELTKYLDDLQKSPGFSAILNRNQLIEVWFKDTIFLLRKNCINRVDLARNPQRLCQSDYKWLIESMAIPLIKNIVRAEAHRQGLNLKEVDIAQITRDICRIDPTQQNARQLMGIYSNGAILEISELKLQDLIFNSEYLFDTLKSFSGGNSSNLLPRIIEAVRQEIAEFIKSGFFTQAIKDDYYPHFSESQSISAPGVLPPDTNTISSNQRFAEGLNGKTIALTVTGGIGITIWFISLIFAGIRWFRKKPAQENLQSDRERIRLTTRQGEHKVRSQGARDRRALTGEAGHISRVRRTNLGDRTAKIVSEHSDSRFNSIPESLYVRRLVVQLDKRLEFLEKLDRYASEIGVHYDFFLAQKNNEEVIENLKKIKQALTKFIAPKNATSKNKDKIISNKLESALSIVNGLMQRYYLLSLSNTNTSNNDYIYAQNKRALEPLIDSLLNFIEKISDDFEKSPSIKNNRKIKLECSALLLNLEIAIYDATLPAHAKGYYVEYPSAKVNSCLNQDINTNQGNNEIDLENIETLQAKLRSTIGVILILSKDLLEKFLRLNANKLCNETKVVIQQLECMKSQLTDSCADLNARRDMASKLKQTQASVGSGNPTFFGQLQSAQITQQQTPAKSTMHR